MVEAAHHSAQVVGAEEAEAQDGRAEGGGGVEGGVRCLLPLHTGGGGGQV